MMLKLQATDPQETLLEAIAVCRAFGLDEVTLQVTKAPVPKI